MTKAQNYNCGIIQHVQNKANYFNMFKIKKKSVLKNKDLKKIRNKILKKPF